MKISNVYVFADSLSKVDELMGAARELGDNIVVFALANTSKRAYKLGANSVFELTGSELVENFTKTLANILSDKSGLVLFSNSKTAKFIASSLGAILNVGLCSEVNEISISNDGIFCQKMVYGGMAMAKFKINSKLALVSLASKAYADALDDGDENQEIQKLNSESNDIKLIKNLEKSTSSIELNKSKRIVGVGRGIANKEDLDMCRQLCEIIGAELGCSRPIAESEKWMEHERYIGISSVMAKPDIYIAVGISGQIQHMVGIKDAGKIIAINKDKNAAIFEYADYGIVGDLYKVIPALLSALK